MDDLATRLDLAVRSGVLPDLHAVLVLRGEETLAACYLSGVDQAWGRPLGTVPFTPETLHDLRSVTKSIVSLLYAIALERGEVPAPATGLLAAFPDYGEFAADPARQALTIGHALDMTLGLEWNEDLPYTDPNNSEIAMERSDDRWRFVLGRPVVAPPGTVWAYNGGAAALIGAIIERGAGCDIATYAERHLFGPLGVGPTEWVAGRDGTLSAASGLRMSAPGLARIGRLVLAGGAWEGRQLVPRAWLERIATPAVTTGFGLGYSAQWYSSQQPPGPDASPMLSAMGNGGQRLFVLPAHDLVAVMFCGRYSQPDQWINPVIVLQRLILAGL